MRAKIARWAAVVAVAAAQVCTASAEQWRIVREAEEAETMIPPAHVVPNSKASQGKCVMLSEGGAAVRSALRDLAPSAGEKSGELDFDIDLPQAGRYRVWVRAQWHCVCSNSFNLLTTGNAVLPNEAAAVDGDQTEPFRVKASVPPRTWRWLPAATCDFTAGKQKLRLIQAGHEAQIDAVMVAAGLDEQPPGYEDQSRACVFSLDSSEGASHAAWNDTGAEGQACSLGSADWSDFQLDFLVPPDPKASENGGAWGIAFAQQPKGTSYTVLFSRSDKGTTKADLYLVENGRRKSLASQDCGSLAPQDAHWVRLARLAESITVAVDGGVRLAAVDSTLGGGTVSLLTEKRKGYAFQGLQLTPLVNCMEHFQAGIGDWRIRAGTWRTVQPGGSDQDQIACMGNAADNGGLIVPAWNLGEEYTLSAPVQLTKEGSAGFAFDVQDDTHYRALLIHWKEGGLAEVQVRQVADGRDEVLQSRAVDVDPRQWHTLHLTRQSDVAKIKLDALDLGKCRAPGTSDNGRVGLALASGSACLFGAVKGRSYTAPGNHEFLVEGVEAPITLCQWKPVKATLRVQGHPAAIFLSAAQAGDNPRLEFGRETEGDVRLETTFFKYGSAAAAPADPLAVVPDLLLPPLPDAPRVGIAFQRREGDRNVEYTLLADWESMREVVLQRNGETLQRTCAAKASHPQGHKLYLQIQGNTVSGGVSGVSEIHAALPEPQPGFNTTKISVTTRNFAPSDEAGIVEMQLCD